MVLWGGLRPIASRVVLDALTLLGLSYACLTSTTTTDNNNRNGRVLLSSCFITLATAGGLTNRWTLTLPMVPLLILQGLRRVSLVSNSKYARFTIAALSIFCVLLGAALSILFPAVELPPVNGPYNVGVVDFLMPVNLKSQTDSHRKGAVFNLTTTHLSVRLLYPTLEKPGFVPYLNPETATEFCRHVMRFGAPPPLKEYSWMLHNWRLAGVRATRNAPLLPLLPGDNHSNNDNNNKLPIVLYSHGLGGNAEMYSYQTMALAAHGNLVVSVNHGDGSAPIVQHQPNGSALTFDYNLGQLWRDGKKVEYVRARRARTNQRVEELIAVADSVLRLNEKDQSGMKPSFRNRLQTENVTLMGHSFGGATVLTAAKRLGPGLVSSVVAHEPAVDWMPVDARRSLFASHLLEDLPHTFTGGTGGYEESERNETDSNIHDIDILLLFSHEWREKKWAWSHILEDLHKVGRLGPKDGVSDFGVIKDARHNEFSDSCMLTPVWLARGVGVTGKRNPIETAVEIEERTRAFLENVRRLK